MKNYQRKNFGKFSELQQYVFEPQDMPLRVEGKVFLSEPLGLTSMEVSLNNDSPDSGVDFFHRHTNNEEIYIFLAGKGEMIIDNEQFTVSEGTVVSVKPEASRSWWNTGEQDLSYIVVQAPYGGLKLAGVLDGEILEGKVPWGK